MITWIAFPITPAIAAVISGTIVGLFARSQQWSEKRFRWTVSSGIGLSVILAAIVQERIHLPYPPGALAKSGHSFLSFLATIVYASVFGLSIPLAVKLARCIARNKHL
jgi:uncharacterized membrane protein YqgA involved in biofilm formation